MNREYFGPTIRRGTFLCMSFKLEDFVIRKDEIEELDEYFREYKIPNTSTRFFDPYNTIGRALM